jgi:hypothetical protein
MKRMPVDIMLEKKDTLCSGDQLPPRPGILLEWSGVASFSLSSIQPMPLYETLFHLKIMANGKNLASGKSFKYLEKIVFL